jgi:hypothetical protein
MIPFDILSRCKENKYYLVVVQRLAVHCFFGEFGLQAMIIRNKSDIFTAQQFDYAIA